MGLSRELILRGTNDSVVQAYLEYMIDMAVIFGADRDRAEKEMLDVLAFEMKLANVCEFFSKFFFFSVNEVCWDLRNLFFLTIFVCGKPFSN